MKQLSLRPCRLAQVWIVGALCLFLLALSATTKAGKIPPPHGALAREISGRVVSGVDGSPLPGVSILIKGSSTGTTTSVDGNFKLTVPGDNTVLVFSFIGFETQEISVGNRSRIDLKLIESIEVLDEAVVTALGIKREVKSLSYSIGKVKGEDMVNVAQENVVNALAGRVAGLTLNQTSGVGSSVNIVIRGATSLSGDNQPLFVIDGVPMINKLNSVKERNGDRNNVDYGNIISDLNPEDIASVSVLKGPSAAALYGSRAGKGVILITTKSGKKGQGLGVTFSTSNVFEVPYRFLDLHYKYANGDRNNRLDEGSSYWGGPELDKGILAPQWNSPLDENGEKIPTPLKSYKDNMKNFLQTGITSTNNLSVSGSKDKFTYRVSYDYMKHRGLIPNSDLKRHSLGTSLQYEMSRKVRLSANLNFVNSSSGNRPSTANRGSNPLEAAYNWSATDIRELKEYWVSGGENIQQRTVNKNHDNPYFLAYGVTNSYDRNHAYGNVRLDWDIFPTLKLYGRVTHDISAENRETKIPWSYSRASTGAYHLSALGHQETNMDFMLTYQRKLSGLDVLVSAGANDMVRRWQDSYMGGAPISVPGLYRISNVPTGARANLNNTYIKRIQSVFGTANIGYKEQLYLDLTARNDWSSTLHPDNRSYFYPSAGLSWLPNHTFNLPEQINLLKLRATWAQVGNDTDPYQLFNELGIDRWGDLITTRIPEILLNPQLKPEIATSREFGLELNLFKNALRFEGSYFYTENKNQILNLEAASSSGYKAAKINAGQLSSRGWELTLGATPVLEKNGWTVDVNANFTHTRTRIDKLSGDMQYYTLWETNGGGAATWLGEDIGNLYSRGYKKITDPASPYYQWPLLDKNGEWQRDDNFTAREKVGNFNPRFLFGGQVSIRYKRFSLGANFDWRQGGNFFSYTYRYGESDWKSQRQLDNLIPGGLYNSDELERLLESDPARYIIPQNGNFPRVGGHTKETGGMPFGDAFDGGFIPGVIEDGEGGYIKNLGGEGTKMGPITDIFPWRFDKQITFDASFVKLREITLGYSIPKVGRFSNVNFSVYSRNIMLWTAAKIGIDPERAFQNDNGRFNQGIEQQNVYPWTMPVGFKIGVSF